MQTPHTQNFRPEFRVRNDTSAPGPCEEALHTTLPFKMAGADRAQRCCDLERENTHVPIPRELCPRPSPLIERHKAAPPTVPRGERRNSGERARTSPFFDQRIKLSFAYEPNLVSFYWYERHKAEGLFLGTDSGRSVTQGH